MPLDKSKVLLGAPDQLTTGAIKFAPVGTTLPTSADAKPAAAFKDAGYVSEDGVSMSAEYNTTDIKDWSKTTIRTILDEFTGELSWQFMQTDLETLQILFGEDNVVVNGQTITVKMNASLPPRRSFIIDVKDGDNKVRIIAPDAQPSLDGEITFNASEVINFGVKLSCLRDDKTGDNIQILTNTGGSTTTP